ncbi:SAM-dependent methyltransferase [Litorivivens lipolytica]|uniref:SAM-dependent methyltransferase n=1 Tax=Litorivivens lipolytica TaxID=1524264 RepID=A0A7W4W365_9GAMM|nr:class I SAM-dependent methyltransferase [Litorivivens lipolytica]MBB3046049.1 SAM-dependent methyltransferase [Litorivivens lipolytica]
MSKDRFSQASDAYQQFRPRYDISLFKELAALSKARHLAWDCGCGTGQASVLLAEGFEQVIATDLSASQVAQANHHPRVSYAAARAEQMPLFAQSCDLVLIAQALHWFDFDAFFKEVERVLKPDGLLVAVTYNLLTVSPEIDALVHHLYYEVLQGYWDAERKHVENGYADIPLPYTVVSETGTGHGLKARWSAAHMLGYLRTWSGVKQYQKHNGIDPVSQIEPALIAAWETRERNVEWPLTVLVRRKPG